MINKLILGTVQLGLNYGINNHQGKPSKDKAFEILNTAFDNGVTILDTAEAYGNSQEIIGQFLKDHPYKKFKIITKLAADSTIKANHMLDHIQKNCSTLNVDKLYGYMFHNYQSFKEKQCLNDKFLTAKDKGLIDKLGISLYTNNEIEDIINNHKGFDFIQIPFNIFDNASKRKVLIEKARDQKIEIHTRSVFLQGLFFKNPMDLHKKLFPLKPYLKQLKHLLDIYGLNVLTLSLQYALQKEYIDHVLIGLETKEQLEQNIKICSTLNELPLAEIDLIDVKEIDLLNPANWT